MIEAKLCYLIKACGMKKGEVAKSFELLPQNFNRKLKSESLKPQELIKLCELLGLEIHFVSKETGQTMMKFDSSDLTQ